MLNNVCLMGRLTRDPELRSTTSGTSVATFTLAVDRDYSKGDSKQTDFIDCTAWRSTAEFVNKYFTKGQMVVVVGELQMRTWQDKNGNNRKTFEVVVNSVYFGDSKKSSKSVESESNGDQSFADLPSGDYPLFP